MNARAQAQMTDSLAALQARGDHFTRQLLQEKQRVSRYEAQLKELNEEIGSVRERNKRKAIDLLNKHTSTTKKSAYQRVDGKDPTRLAEINQKKLVENLESRLDKALARQSVIDSENSVIKAKIDKLRRKVDNDSVNRKNTEKQLKALKDDVGGIMKRAADVSDQRDRILEVQNQLIRENLEEREKFNEEYVKLSDYIQEQNDLLECSIAKVASDVVTKLEKVEITQPSEDCHGEENKSPHDEMKALDEKLERLEQQYEGYLHTLEQAEEKNRLYNESFKKLQEVSGLTSTEDIIHAFVENEEESFSLFNYIQDMNQECDKILEERANTEEEIDEYERKQGKTEGERKIVLDQYRVRLCEAQEEKNKLHEANRERKMTVLHIANTIQGLYLKLRCRQLEVHLPSVKEPKATHDRKLTMFAGEQLSERNILDRLTLIEKRTMQIVAEYAKSLVGSPGETSRRPTALMVRYRNPIFLCYLLTLTNTLLCCKISVTKII